jgi:hypothetical protein
MESLILIRDKTRLEQLIERFNSRAQAKFYIEKSGGNFKSFEREHNSFYSVFEKLTSSFKDLVKTKIVFREFLPTYIFSEKEVVVAIGQDGLVANTAKYLSGQVLVGVNPDPQNYDGVLLPFDQHSVVRSIKNLLQGRMKLKEVYLAVAELNDGQKLMAFNDFYIGARSHVSSRYTVEFQGKKENQSSSGIIVSTKAGATGWLSSVLNMASNILKQCSSRNSQSNFSIDQNESQLVFAIREPFKSVSTQTTIGFGIIQDGDSLKIESKMVDNGVIFSDGIEADFLQFNAGSIVEIKKADVIVKLLQDS